MPASVHIRTRCIKQCASGFSLALFCFAKSRCTKLLGRTCHVVWLGKVNWVFLPVGLCCGCRFTGLVWDGLVRSEKDTCVDFLDI